MTHSGAELAEMTLHLDGRTSMRAEGLALDILIAAGASAGVDSVEPGASEFSLSHFLNVTVPQARKTSRSGSATLTMGPEHIAQCIDLLHGFARSERSLVDAGIVLTDTREHATIERSAKAALALARQLRKKLVFTEPTWEQQTRVPEQMAALGSSIVSYEMQRTAADRPPVDEEIPSEAEMAAHFAALTNPNKQSPEDVARQESADDEDRADNEAVWRDTRDRIERINEHKPQRMPTPGEVFGIKPPPDPVSHTTGSYPTNPSPSSSDLHYLPGKYLIVFEPARKDNEPPLNPTPPQD